MTGIYKITSPDSRIYIGQSINIRARWSQYLTISNKKVKESFSLYGFENHIFEIIEECEISLLNERERFYQDFYDVLGPNGLNYSLTGTSSRPTVFSKEYREKLSNSQKNRTDYKANKSNLHSYRDYGTSFSEEHRLKLSINNSMNRKVVNIVTGEVFRSIKVASDSIGMKTANLENRLKGVVKNKTNLKYL